MNPHKTNLLALAEHHKKYCKSSTCNVSLVLLRLLAEKANITFTEEEKGVFI